MNPTSCKQSFFDDNAPSIRDLRRLKYQPCSPGLARILDEFDQPRSICLENFKQGVMKFIELANSNTTSEQGRAKLYGDKFCGLNYRQNIVELWNSTYSIPEDADNSLEGNKKQADALSLVPSQWDSMSFETATCLVYLGQEPAQALDQLIKGPAVIDCGMFCQLSLWFGIRYLLGNARFNEYFGAKPFYITQLLYEAVENVEPHCLGNPLFDFFSENQLEQDQQVVRITHIPNIKLYQLKHPGGVHAGQNCIVMDKKHYIFNPKLERNGFSAEEVSLQLRDAFNQERTFDEGRTLSLYHMMGDEIHPGFNETYWTVTRLAQLYRTTQYSVEAFQAMVRQEHAPSFSFDLQKFSAWLEMQPQARPGLTPV